MIRKALLAMTLFLFSGLALSYSVGTVPGSLDLGTVEPGSTVEQNIYVTVSDVDQNFTVSPYANGVSPSTLFSGDIENRDEISEQASTDWWRFDEPTIDPSTELSDSEIEDSGVPSVQGVMAATLEVPEDAEPGYRYGHIRVNPQFSDPNSSGSGARIVTPTRLSYSFRVAGEVRRNIVVDSSQTRAFRLGEEEAAVEVLLRNEGTVTTSTEDFQVDVLDATGATEATLTAGDAVLEPGEERYVEASWGSEDGIEEGAYQIDGRVDYLTGEATASGSFSLPGFDVVEVRPDDSPGSDEQDGRGGLPLWLVAMILVLLGVLMWSFGIDPFWILLIVGIFGISAFILMSGISNYLLILLLMVVGIVVYGGL